MRAVCTPCHWISFSRTTAASAARIEARAESVVEAGASEPGGAASPAGHEADPVGVSPRPRGAEAGQGCQVRLLGGARRGGESGRGRLESRRSRPGRVEEEEREPREGERERVGPEAWRRYGERKPFITEGVGVPSKASRRRRYGGSGERSGERLRGGRRWSRRSESGRGRKGRSAPGGPARADSMEGVAAVPARTG